MRVSHSFSRLRGNRAKGIRGMSHTVQQKAYKTQGDQRIVNEEQWRQEDDATRDEASEEREKLFQ